MPGEPAAGLGQDFSFGKVEPSEAPIEDGWNIAAWEALVMDEDDPSEFLVMPGGELPDEVLLDGFSVAAFRPLIGYVVELWIHNTGREAGRVVMRPRYAMQLADLVTQAICWKGFSRKLRPVPTDLQETVQVYPRLGGGVLIVTDGTQATFAKAQAKELVAKLRQAAVAHLGERSTALAG